MFHPIPADGFEWSARPWGDVLACTPLAAAADHFFTARNLALGEDASGWRQVAGAVGVEPENLLLVKQIHGATVALATRGRQGWTRPEADVIATDDPGTAVAIQTADCVPILLAEDTGRAVAAVHAGWRGLAMRAPIAAVDALLDRFGVRPERLIAAIGPAIGACCYEVGPEVRQAFALAGHHPHLLDRWFAPRPGGRFHLDTVAAARGQLEGAGIPPPRIHAADLCTQSHSNVFHSYRADGPRAGRMAAVIRPRAEAHRQDQRGAQRLQARGV
jgi:YfiH family protein